MEGTIGIGMEEDELVPKYTPTYDQETIENLKNEFSRLKDECYLDHAGTTLYSNTQIKEITNDLCFSLYGNPHSLGSASSTSHEIIERTRYRILDYFHAIPDEYSVIFTSGATASLKTVAETFCFEEKGNFSSENAGNFVYIPDNHTSVLGMREVVVRRGAKVTCLNHDEAFKTFCQASISTNLDIEPTTNSIFVYSAQCNFSGLKYPLKWIKDVQNGALDVIVGKKATRWYVCLDAAAFVATNDLDLSIFKPDFVCLSFYKMFGYPTGIGALLVKNSSANALDKIYYGGGTINVSLSSEMFHVKRDVLHHRFEDGTVSFLSIVSLQHGFNALSSISLEKISQHVFSLARYLHHSLLLLHHCNGQPVAKLYSDTDYEDRNLQGGVVTFNLLRFNGEFVGYMEVLNMAALYKIHLRTGCFCNPGACQRHLHLSSQEVLENYDAGYVCGGSRDLINGKPTGAVRISLGYMSTIEDVQNLLCMIKKCFLDGLDIVKVPVWWTDYRTKLKRKYYNVNTAIRKENGIVSTKDACNEKEHLKLIADKYISSPMSTVNVKCNEPLRVERLFIYPIKSCAAYEVNDFWILGSKGLKYDREWMIVTSAGVCLTQKQQIYLCLIKPRICLEQNAMELTYPGMPSIQVPLIYSCDSSKYGTMCRTRVCGHRVEGTDCGEDVSEWLSLALGHPGLRLLRQKDQGNQSEEGTSKPELSFNSQAQYLLINEASVNWLVNKIPDDSECQKETILHRFRGNIITRGYDPFQEMKWNHVRIGNNDFKVDGPCIRCYMVCIDQMTAKKTVEPLRTLAEEFHGKMKFGIYLSRQAYDDEIIKIGDLIN